MGMTTTGADRVLNSIIGQNVAAGGTPIRAKLHTADPPTTANELSGNGYAAVPLTATSGSLSTVSGDRRLTLPDMVFFTDAGAAAQDAASFGIWFGNTLIYDDAVALDPDDARVAVEGAFIELDLGSSTLALQNASADLALRSLVGGVSPARNMYFAFHHGTAVPAESNRVTGGGLVPIVDGPWSLSTVAGYRRASQAALSAATSLTGALSAQVTRCALWREDPSTHASPVLHAYGPVPGGFGMPESGASIPAASGAVYIEVNIAGVAA